MYSDKVPIRGLKPWGNPYAMLQGPGYQVNWAKVSSFYAASKQIVQANGAASVGADALTVDALLDAVRAGERIDFGKVDTVVVTVGVAGAAQGATSVPVAALTGPIPSGAVLSTGPDEFIKLSAPAAKAATTLTVVALVNALESGDTATYEGGQNIVTVTADAAEGATSLAISNLDFAIADNQQGVYQRNGVSSGDRFIPEATIMVLDPTTTPTTQFPRHDAATEQANHFLASDAYNGRQGMTHSRSGYGTVVGNTFIYENLCPDADSNGDLPSAYKTELIANANFKAHDFVDYVDTRA